MKRPKSSSIHPKHLQNARALQRDRVGTRTQTPVSVAAPAAPPAASTIRTTPRDFINPVDYQHPYASMGRFAQALALRYDANRTRHAYYRQVRLIHEHFALDPALLTEDQLREYVLVVKLQKHWKPKSIRQALAASRQFFVDLLGQADWTVFRQIRTQDHDELPAVLTRQQVHALLAGIRLRRYRTPLKLMLIYVCGLRLSERLALTSALSPFPPLPSSPSVGKRSPNRERSRPVDANAAIGRGPYRTPNERPIRGEPGQIVR